MSRIRRILCLGLPALALLTPAMGLAAASVDPAVTEALSRGQTSRVWIHLNERADLSPAEDLITKEEKGRFVFETLTQTARTSQGPLLQRLDARGIAYHSFWITNAVVADVDSDTLQWLRQRPEVRRIAPNPTFNMLQDAERGGDPAPEAASTVEWNVAEVGAPAAWALGYSGQGIVVASADTGVDWDHPALRNSYRGSGARVDHDYNWFDAINGDNTPYDDNGHGTFTTGQMTGEDGANQVGVAPDATWIACKNMDGGGYGTPESYTACFEFFIAPTDGRGQNPDPSLAPDIVNNSWGCPTYEGCDKNTLVDIVDATQAAGVMLIVSAGNSGPGCMSVEDPPATYPQVLTVGAYNAAGELAGFSSRGPSAYDRGVKPNIAAPGVQVRSSIPGGGYANGWSGTSMASPEVAAAAAILWSADPTLIGDIDGTRAALEGTSEFTRGYRCGGERGYGNNMWGTGKLDIPAALRGLE